MDSPPSPDLFDRDGVLSMPIRRGTPSLSGSSGTVSTDRSSLGGNGGSSALTADRRRSARARLSAALKSAKPWQPPPPDLTTMMAAAVSQAQSSAPEVEESAADLTTTSSTPALSPELIAKKADQLGRLGIITSASGWDIKLRELAMKEANQPVDDPEEEERRLREDEERLKQRHSDTKNRRSRSRLGGDRTPMMTPPMSSPAPDPGGLLSPTSSIKDGYFALSTGTGSGAGSAQVSPERRRRSSSVLALRTARASMADVEGATAFTGFGSGDALASPVCAPGGLVGAAAAAAAAEQAEAEEDVIFSTIVTAYDERLREIVIEAARPAIERVRVGRRSTVANLDFTGVARGAHGAVVEAAKSDAASKDEEDGAGYLSPEEDAKERKEPMSTSTPPTATTLARKKSARRKRTQSLPSTAARLARVSNDPTQPPLPASMTNMTSTPSAITPSPAPSPCPSPSPLTRRSPTLSEPILEDVEEVSDEKSGEGTANRVSPPSPSVRKGQSRISRLRTVSGESGSALAIPQMGFHMITSAEAGGLGARSVEKSGGTEEKEADIPDVEVAAVSEASFDTLVDREPPLRDNNAGPKGEDACEPPELDTLDTPVSRTPPSRITPFPSATTLNQTSRNDPAIPARGDEGSAPELHHNPPATRDTDPPRTRALPINTYTHPSTSGSETHALVTHARPAAVGPVHADAGNATQGNQQRRDPFNPDAYAAKRASLLSKPSSSSAAPGSPAKGRPGAARQRGASNPVPASRGVDEGGGAIASRERERRRVSGTGVGGEIMEGSEEGKLRGKKHDSAVDVLTEKAA
ncbi:hypothetical protein HK101_004078 [Irineochytrium annulatum]|nr:hypothetical protein HK101_004078 [Irineochytrium annulatum]